MTRATPGVVCGSILFTDLVGFTEYTDAVGDVGAADVLDQQRRRVDGLLPEPAAGRVVKELGDGLMLWFASAEIGLAFAVALLHVFDGDRRAGTFPLAIRMGVHHGDSVEHGSDLVGHTVNVAARISALAGAGELLVSEEVRVAGPDAARSIPMRPIGPVLVKGVRAPIWLHRVMAG